MRKVSRQIVPVFEDYVFDWNYRQYLLVGGYGSGKSYQTAYKIVMRLFEENRRAIVAAPDLIAIEKTYAMVCKVLDDLGVLAPRHKYEKDRDVVRVSYQPGKRKKPMRAIFHNGSKILFFPLDMEMPSTFFYDTSILWVDEAQDCNKADIEDLKSRMRWGGPTKQYIYTANAKGKDNWLYKEYFKVIDTDDTEHVKVDEAELYEKQVILHDGVYYHHSTISDNPFATQEYILKLNDIIRYDRQLYMQGRWGRYTCEDRRLFPRLEVVWKTNQFDEAVSTATNRYHGLNDKGDTIVSLVTKNNIEWKFDDVLIYDKVILDNNDLIAKEKCLWFKESQTPIYASTTNIDSVLWWISKGYNIVVTEQPLMDGIKKLQQYRRILVAPEQDKMYREIKGITYNKDRNDNAVYDWLSIQPNYITAISNALSQIDTEFIKRSGVDQNK